MLYAWDMLNITIILRRLSISTFNASKELPSQVEVDLLLILWLNKLSSGVCAKLEEESNRLIRDPDPRQKRRNKAAILESGGKPTIPLIKGDLYGGVSDGRVLAALLLHYAPQACTWNGEKFLRVVVCESQLLRIPVTCGLLALTK